jgi:hypothetical protein
MLIVSVARVTKNLLGHVGVVWPWLPRVFAGAQNARVRRPLSLPPDQVPRTATHPFCSLALRPISTPGHQTATSWACIYAPTGPSIWPAGARTPCQSPPPRSSIRGERRASFFAAHCDNCRRAIASRVRATTPEAFLPFFCLIFATFRVRLRFMSNRVYLHFSAYWSTYI